jgi:hypothetical protein
MWISVVPMAKTEVMAKGMIVLELMLADVLKGCVISL